ncbi:hypothetical protein ACWC6I_41310 [Streptomyces sp. NPDC001414]
MKTKQRHGRGPGEQQPLHCVVDDVRDLYGSSPASKQESCPCR